VSRCGGSIYAFCNYAKGQMTTALPYTSGTPCSQCALGLCSNNLCHCSKVCQNYGTLDTSTCTCNCTPYATGELCEKLVCDKSDNFYGCWGDDPNYCKYSNVVFLCPHLCGICRV
jgi:hypothetical protein